MGLRRLAIASLLVTMSVALWSAVPAGASPAPPGAFPMGSGLCGKRAKVYDKIWTVKAHDGRNVFLRCGEFPSDRGGDWGWRHTPIANGLSWRVQETVESKQPDVTLDMDLITMGRSRI